MKTFPFFLIQALVLVLISNPFQLSAQTPTLSYPAPLSEYAPGQAIDFDVDLYSNGLIDQLCAVRYFIYKDDMTNPVASVTPFGTISYTVRSQGASFVTNSITDGQGFISVDALNDVLQAFTLGIFDNYCVDRDRPINVDMNFSVPGNYRFTIEIVSCSNTGISAGTTFTATNCGGLLHTDSVADTCTTPVVLNTYSMDFKVCGESSVTKLSGSNNYIAGDSVEYVFSIGEYDDGVNFTEIPSWLSYSIDNNNHTLTISGIAPASNGNQTYLYHFITNSSVNPSTCYHGSYGQFFDVSAPSVTFSPFDTLANVAVAVNTTLQVYSNGLVDELCGVRYAIYKDDSTTPIADVDDYGSITCYFRGQGSTQVADEIHTGSGYIDLDFAGDTVRAFTLGIFDNFCVDRQRPIDLYMDFIVPGEYRFDVELVSCSNPGVSTGTSFTAVYCGGQVHTDSVAEHCVNPSVLTSESIDITICSPSYMNYASGSTDYVPGDTVNLTYYLGAMDDLIGESEIPEWLTYSIDSVNDFLTFTGIVPPSNGNTTYTFDVSAAASINPATCLADTEVVQINVNAPSVVYSAIDPSYSIDENISTTALVYSNGFVDELCGVRYAIYKDSSTTPIDSIHDFGTVSYTVRGQGSALITTPIKTGQGYIEVYALSDTLQAFTLGIFDNYCIDRNRPIDIDMNFSVPGNYRFEAEIISCSNAGISTGSTFTDQNCGGTMHTDSVATTCQNPTVLTTGAVETNICGESEITFASGQLSYFPGQPINIVYNVGEFDNGINTSNLPSWLTYSSDTAANTITVTGTAPAYDPMNASYNIAVTTASTLNPATCPTATANLTVQVIQGPEIDYTSLNAIYQVGDTINTTARVYSHGYVDELAAVSYEIYRNAALVNQVSDLGYIDYKVRLSGSLYDTTEIETGSGFITMKPAADTLRAFTLGIFDNSCVNRNRPVDMMMTFTHPGNYLMNTELVSCTNAGVALGSSFVATNCDNLTHYDSVAQQCAGPQLLFAESVGFTVCAESEISYASGSDIYCAGSQIDLVYNVGSVDDGINSSSLPAWLTYSVNTANHTVSLHGTVPQYDALNPTYSINLSTTSSENPAVCPNASLIQNITVKESYNDTIVEVICEGDSIELLSYTYNTTGIYPNTFTAVNGCDSIVVLDLTVNPTVYDEFTISTDDSSYTWNTIAYHVSGDYTQTLSSAITGCDSVVTLHLTITVGIDELNNAVVSVYPNPTDNFIYVETNTETGSQCLIEVHDVYGRIISSTEITDNKTIVDLSEMASGVYFLKVIDGEKITGTAFVTKQ